MKDGPPKNAEPGLVGVHAQPTNESINGILGHTGKPCRFTFKGDDAMPQLWVGNAERTEKIPYASIRAVLSDPIEGHPGYCILSLQMGTSDKTKRFFYFVPNQYFRAIRSRITGMF